MRKLAGDEGIDRMIKMWIQIVYEQVHSLINRELAQKPHESHAAFGHCAKPRAEIKFEVTEKPS
jgi:hypothetical protein